MVPGRPRRQQQAYRRANTSLNLSTTSDYDAYTSGTIPNGMGAIVDSSPSKTRSVKDFLLKRTYSKDQINNYVPASTIEAFNSFTSGAAPMSVTNNTMSGPMSGYVSPPSVPTSAVPPLPTDSSSVDWSPASTGDDSSVINDLTISAPRQQPKYSYLVGRSNTTKDLWRTTLPASSGPATAQTPTVTKRRSHLYGGDTTADTYVATPSVINNSNTISAAGLSYEDRINTALGRKPVGAASRQPFNQYTSGSNNVQKSKSYSNFDTVRRDYGFQVELSETCPCKSVETPLFRYYRQHTP